MFNLVLNLYTWIGSGNHSLAAFGLVLGAALAFDLTHVGASLAFGFAFGPGLRRILTRVRGRLEVRWEDAPPRRRGRAARRPARRDAARAVHPGAGARAHRLRRRIEPAPAHDARVAIARELAYLKGAQNTDGGFGAAPGQPSSELYTAWAAIGLAAAGRDPRSWPATATRCSTRCAAKPRACTERATSSGRSSPCTRAGASVRSLPGGDPVVRLLAFRARDGSFAHLSNLTAFAILALRAAGYGPRAPQVAVGGALARPPAGRRRRASASPPGAAAATWTTPPRRCRPCAAPGRAYARALARGAAFLRRAQNLDGGFPQQRGGPSNAQSTAWAIQAFAAAGVSPVKVTRAGSRSPLAYLETLVGPDGSVRYSRMGAQTPVWVTAQALTAFAQRPLPIAPVQAGFRTP